MTDRFPRVCVIVFALLTLVPVAGFAQLSQSSSIAGVVRDTSGAVLPGVSVEAASPALIEKIRTAVTDGQGQYQLVNLRPGTYTVTFTLAGFSPVQREGVELPASFTATVNADMRVGALEETITVSGGTPAVDVRNSSTQKLISSELIETLPTTRSSAMVAYAPTVPGAVGGLGLLSVASTAISVHGSTSGEANLTIDGFPIRVIYTMLSYYWPNQGTVQEVVVQTDGQSAESQLSSVWLNTVPKTGSNRFSGNFFALYADHRMQADNLTPKLKAQGLTSVSSLKKQWEVTPSGGGPIIRDRLWFYAAYQENPIVQNLANNYYNKDPRAWTYAPDLSRPAFVQIRNYSKELRLTWQATPKNNVNLSIDHTPHYTDERSFNSLVSPEATSYSPYLPMLFYTSTWRSTVTNHLLFEAGGGSQISNIDNRRQFIGLDQQVGYDVIPARDVNRNYYFRSAPIPGSVVPDCTCVTYGASPSHVFMGRASASYITGSHSAKIGMTLIKGSDARSTQVNGDMGINLLDGQPSSVSLFATPYETLSTVNADLGLYAQDQWAFKRVTANYGLRFDYLHSSTAAEDLAAGRFVPARHYDAVDNVPNWKDITPRLGVAYDLFGDGKTALKASLGKFVDFEATGIANAFNGVTRSVTTATRTLRIPAGASWFDANGNPTLNCDFSNPALNGWCDRLSNLNFGLVNPNATTFNPTVTQGWGVRPYNWTSSVQLQHELYAGVSVAAGYYRRSEGNFRAIQNTFVAPADYSRYCINAPVDPRLPHGGGNQICGLYDVSAIKFGQSQRYTTAAKDFGKQTQLYNGFDLTTSIRRVKGVTLNGGSSWGRTATNACFVIDSPQALLYCDVRPPFQPNIKFSGVYTLPWWNLQTAAVYQNLPGPMITASYTASNAEIIPSLGRNLSSGATGTAVVPLIQPGTLYGPRVTQVDLRVLKSVAVGHARVTGTVQIFNLLNSSAVQSLNVNYGSAASHASWLQPTIILQARYLQVTGQISF